MAKVVYNGALPSISFGTVGVFEPGVPREIDDNLAAALVAKGRLEYVPAEGPAARKQTGKADTAAVEKEA